VLLYQHLPLAIVVLVCMVLLVLMLWLADVVPGGSAAALLPVCLLAGLAAVAATAIPKHAGGLRYFFVTTQRVLIYRNGWLGNERGAYLPQEMRNMCFQRSFISREEGGDVVFSTEAVYAGNRTKVHVKGLLSIPDVRGVARLIHDTLLRNGVFEERDRTRRMRILHASLAGGLLAFLFLPTLIAIPFIANKNDPSRELKGLDRDLADLRGNMPSVQTLRAMAEAPVEPGRQAEVVGVLEPLARRPDGLIAPAAMQALANWSTPAVLPLAHEVLARSDADGDMRLAAVDILGKHGKEKEVDVLARLMAAGGPTRDRCAAALVRIGKRSVPELERLLGHADSDVREAAGRALEQLDPRGTGDPAGRPGGEEILLLLGGLKDRDAGKQVEAARRLAAMRPDLARRAEVAGALRTSCNSDRLNVRRAALQAFAVWGSRFEAVTLLLASLGSMDPDTRTYSLTTLSAWKEPRAVGPMVRMLNLLDDVQRYDVAVALESMGKVAEPGVVECLSTGNAVARKAALDILTKIGTRDSLPALRAYRDRQVGTSKQEVDPVLEAIERRDKGG
jgi:HEAT repeat protein